MLGESLKQNAMSRCNYALVCPVTCPVMGILYVIIASSKATRCIVITQEGIKVESTFISDTDYLINCIVRDC